MENQQSKFVERLSEWSSANIDGLTRFPLSTEVPPESTFAATAPKFELFFQPSALAFTSLPCPLTNRSCSFSFRFHQNRETAEAISKWRPSGLAVVDTRHRDHCCRWWAVIWWFGGQGMVRMRMVPSDDYYSFRLSPPSAPCQRLH